MLRLCTRCSQRWDETEPGALLHSSSGVTERGLQLSCRFHPRPAPAGPGGSADTRLDPLHSLRHKLLPCPWLCLPGVTSCPRTNPPSSFPAGYPISRVVACFAFTVKSATTPVLPKFPLLSLFPAFAFSWFQPPVLSAITNYPGRTPNWLGRLSAATRFGGHS